MLFGSNDAPLVEALFNLFFPLLTSLDLFISCETPIPELLVFVFIFLFVLVGFFPKSSNVVELGLKRDDDNSDVEGFTFVDEDVIESDFTLLVSILDLERCPDDILFFELLF